MSLTLAAQLPHPIHQFKATTAVTSTASYRADAPARPQPPGDRQVGLTVPLRFAGSEDLEGARGVYVARLTPSLP